jgi:hypothetical protein
MSTVKEIELLAEYCKGFGLNIGCGSADRIISRNPGYCFKRAGWRACGKTQKGLIILERLNRII